MKIAIFEENLMWGPRLVQSVRGLGYEPLLIDRTTTDIPDADLAIINLGSPVFPPESLVPALKAKSILIIAHAGHKEKQLHEIGKDLNCDYLATNSELTFKLPQIIQKVTEPSNSGHV
jgi:N-acetylglutamate synthase/N-acetylornithine aminotransferase